MGNKNDGFEKELMEKAIKEKNENRARLEHDHQLLEQIRTPRLEGDAKILYEAYMAFAKGGMTHDKEVKLQKIDELLTHATIQLTKNGGAVITDDNGKVTTIHGR